MNRHNSKNSGLKFCRTIDNHPAVPLRCFSPRYIRVIRSKPLYLSDIDEQHLPADIVRRTRRQVQIIAASVAQEETLRFFSDRLQDVDLAKLQKRVLKFMETTRPGSDPTSAELNQLTGRNIR
jgi:hypothetical protein